MRTLLSFVLIFGFFIYQIEISTQLCFKQKICCLNRLDTCKFDGCFCDEYCITAKDCCTDYQKCCGFLYNTTSDRQNSKQKWFRVAMALSDYKGADACIKQILCKVGCSDMTKYKARDNSNLDLCGLEETPYMKELLAAFNKGQDNNPQFNAELSCNRTCAGLYPNCTSTLIEQMLTEAHTVGVKSFDEFQNFIESYGKIQENYAQVKGAMVAQTAQLMHDSGVLIEKLKSQGNNQKIIVIKQTQQFIADIGNILNNYEPMDETGSDLFDLLGKAHINASKLFSNQLKAFF